MDKVRAREFGIKKERKTTMGRKNVRILCAVVFCMIGLPLLLSFGIGGGQSREREAGAKEEFLLNQADAGYDVVCERPSGMLHIPMEEYLISTIAQVMGPEEPAEAMRALAVLLRTQVVYESELEGGCFVEQVKLLEELREEWGEQSDAYMEIYRSAVADTAGIIMTWQGEVMETAYHQVSAGNTRNGSEVFGDRLPYLISVACEEDLMSPQYYNRISFSKKDFFEKLRLLTGDENLTSAELIIDQRDSAGYVISLTIRPEDTDAVQIGGETFRSIMGLPSSHFSMEEEGDTVSFLCKGVGHGFGMSVYSACRLAEKGTGFMDILRYFYPETVFMRIA